MMQDSEAKIVTFNLCVTVKDSVIPKKENKMACSFKDGTVNNLDFWSLL